jgi:hypothetical protein
MMKQFVQIHYKYDPKTPTLSVDCIQVNSVPVAVVLVANRVAGAVGDQYLIVHYHQIYFVLEVLPKLQLQKLDYL